MKGQMVYFPTEEVGEGTRVIIYGANDVGEILLYQNRVLEHCSIVAFIDQAAEREVLGVPVFNKEELEKLSFDKIIIAAISAQEEICNGLLEMGIVSEKIVCCRWEEWDGKRIPHFREESYIFRVIQKEPQLLRNRFFRMNYYYTIRKDIPRVVNSQMCNFPEYTVAEQLTDFSSFFWENPQYLYSSFYEDRKKKMQEYAIEFLDRYGRKVNKVVQRECKRVAVFGYDLVLGKECQAPSKLIAEYSNMFSRMGYQVKVFIEDSTWRRNTWINTENERQKDFFDPDVKVIRLREWDFEKRMVNLFDKVQEFQPDLIVNCSAEVSVLAYFFYRKIPIFHIFLTGFRTSVPADYFFSGYCQSAIQRGVREGYSMDLSKYVSLPLNFTEQKPTNSCRRKDYNFSSENFIIVTVGYNLNSFMTDEFISEVVSMLIKNPLFVWWIIGPDNLQERFKNFSKSVVHNQIRFSLYEENLSGIYQMADIYLNPQRKGGGWGIAQAVVDGLPVLTNNIESAGKEWIGEKNTISGGTRELCEMAVRIYREPKIRADWQERMHKRKDEYDLDGSKTIQLFERYIKMIKKDE